MLNHIAILFKKFMYDNKNHLLRSHIIALMNYLKSNEKFEQRSAYDKDKLETHFRKWNPMEHLL